MLTLDQLVAQTDGIVKVRKGIRGIWFDGPPEAPKNALFIPLADLGYNPEKGIFRKSIRPTFESILESQASVEADYTNR